MEKHLSRTIAQSLDALAAEFGFRTVTYGDFANAVNGLAWWIIDNLGQPTENNVLTYIGPNDLRYPALTLAAGKTGYVAFLTSPRNSPEAHRSLFETIRCQTLLTTEPTPPPAQAVIQAVTPRVLAIPSLKELLGKTHPQYACSKTFEQPYIGLDWHAKAAHLDSRNDASPPDVLCASPPDGAESVEQLYRGKRVMVTLPPFHGAGVTSYLFNWLALDTIAVSPAAMGIVSGQGLLEALTHTPAEVALLVPSVVAELAQDEDLLKACAKHLKLILYIGGDLPKAVGDKVASVIPLRCQWGASEVAIPQQLLPAELGSHDWRYIRFHPSLGATLEGVTDELYELVISRSEHLKDTQVSFSIPGLDKLDKEYRTRDYFAKHPIVANAWCWKARADDIIVFLNGEKTNPISMEQEIMAKNAELTGALVDFETTANQAALIERIWPSVESANALAPAHARVEKIFIVVAKKNLPFIRAGKGTFQRSATLRRYTYDIDQLYANAEATSSDDDITGLSEQGGAFNTTEVIRNIVGEITEWPEFSDADSFFDHGLDSLQALRITRAIRRALRCPTFAMSVVYTNPTVEQLAAALSDGNAEGKSKDSMQSLLSIHTAFLKSISVPIVKGEAAARPRSVILTGSTGYLGTYVLHSLLGQSSFDHVFCLNRGAGGGKLAQSRSLKRSNINEQDLEGRVTFIEADLAHPKLGLDEKTYTKLMGEVGLIIHNACPVRFDLELDAFRPQLAGAVNLCALTAATQRPAQMLFVSSVTSTGPSPDGQPAQEIIKTSLDTPHPQGYAQSKFLAELLFDTASKHLGLPVSIARVGQVAGPIRRKGLWNPREWLPSLLRSSIYLGCLPENLGPQFTDIDWIPSDIIGDIFLDLVANASLEDQSGAQVFNLRNPNTTTWQKLLPTIQEVLQEQKGQQLEIVAPPVWRERLQHSMDSNLSKDDAKDSEATTAENPALTLFDFFRDNLWGQWSRVPPMAIERATESSPTLQSLSAVNPGWVRKWLTELIELSA